MYANLTIKVGMIQAISFACITHRFTFKKSDNFDFYAFECEKKGYF